MMNTKIVGGKLLKSSSLVALLVAGIPSAQAVTVGEQFFAGLQDNSWALVPVEASGIPAYEGHAGWGVDSTGGRLIRFGSDTHTGADASPDNAVHIFDADTLQWTSSGPADHISTYQVDADNWTSTTTGNPWASHTFDNVTYVPELDSVLVVTAPSHNYGGGNQTNTATSEIPVQSWLYDIESGTWSFLKSANTPSSIRSGGLWAKGTGYDPVLGKVVARSAFDAYLFDPQTLQWQVVDTNNVEHAIESAIDFNPVSGNSFVFGRNFGGAELITEYHDDTQSWEEVVTTGLTPYSSTTAPLIAVDTTNNVLIHHGYLQDPSDPNSQTGDITTLILDLETNEWSDAGAFDTPDLPNRAFTAGYLERFNVALFEGVDPASGDSQLWAYRFASQSSIAAVSSPSAFALFLVGVMGFRRARLKPS